MDGYAKYANLSHNPLWALSEDDPRCTNVSCLAYILGWVEDQERYSNDIYPLYALWATYFYCATIAVFMIVYINRRLRDGGSGARFKQRVTAYLRMIVYRRVSGKLGERMDISYGQLSMFTIASIFITILPFFQGYFLRDYFRYGSPPLSVRCAMLISALLPICIALAGKVNIVTLLTGISYAKLNVWHRYIAFVVYILTIVHMIPHFIAPIKEGGYSELRSLIVDGRRERSGIVLQISFTIMLLTSLPFFRNRFYELFKVLHIFFAICFFIFLYWHVAGEYLTPDVFWATVGILIGNFVARAVYRNRVLISFREFVHGFPTSLEVLPGKMTRIVVQCPNKLSWKPGQHCYISMPGISMFQAHPFTIVSLSGSYRNSGANDLVLLMRACKGFTKQVEELAIKSSPSRSVSMTSDDVWSAAAEADVQLHSRAWIDGPYGDFHPALERQYHGVICIAGGSGITSSLPWLVYLASRMRSAANGNKGLHGEKVCKTRTLHLIWSIRKLSWMNWAERELSEAMREVMRANAAPPQRHHEKDSSSQKLKLAFKLQISIYVTQRVEENEMKAALLDLYLGAGVDVYNPHARVEILTGRPNYMQILPNIVDRKKNIVLTCGPYGQKIDVANSVARLQSMVIQDQTMEIGLHSETFGW